jgi:hypothetical protein
MGNAQKDHQPCIPSRETKGQNLMKKIQQLLLFMSFSPSDIKTSKSVQHAAYAASILLKLQKNGGFMGGGIVYQQVC